MSNLREAIEKLCEAQGGDSYVMVHALRSALATHPDLTAEALPVVNREALDKVLVDYLAEADDADVLTDALYDAGLFRDEATVKAEALREATAAARAEAANSRTPQGRYEAEGRADWLEDRATEIDPARLEGAHP